MSGRYPILGNGVTDKIAEEIRSRVADPTEEILGMFKAKKKQFLDSGIERFLVVGSKHLTFWDKSQFEKMRRSSTKTERYDYSKITKVIVEKGLRTWLKFKHDGKKLEFYGLDRKTVDTLAELIDTQINLITGDPQLSNVEKTGVQPVSNPIEMVKIRYAKGEIGKAEMEEMVKSLENLEN